VGLERSEVFAKNNWRLPGRWRLDVELLKRAICKRCVSLTDTGLPNALVLRLHIADPAQWGEVATTLVCKSTYVRNRKELTLSVQLNYKKVRNLDPLAQLDRLRGAVLQAARVAKDELNVPGTVDLVVLEAQLQKVLSSIRVDDVIARAAA
jgi:hypothetical protein